MQRETPESLATIFPQKARGMGPAAKGAHPRMSKPICELLVYCLPLVVDKRSFITGCSYRWATPSPTPACQCSCLLGQELKPRVQVSRNGGDCIYASLRCWRARLNSQCVPATGHQTEPDHDRRQRGPPRLAGIKIMKQNSQWEDAQARRPETGTPPVQGSDRQQLATQPGGMPESWYLSRPGTSCIRPLRLG